MKNIFLNLFSVPAIKHLALSACTGIIFCCISCKQPVQPGEPEAAADAQQLVDSAVMRMNTGNEEDAKLALMLLKRASVLDSNNYFAWWDQVMLYNEQKKYDRSLEAEQHLIRLSHRHPDHLAATGILYFRLKDTASANQYFSEALQGYNSILDTVQPGTYDYDYFVMNKGILMIMQGDQTAGNTLLKELYTATTDTLMQRSMLDFIDKSPEEILEKVDE